VSTLSDEELVAKARRKFAEMDACFEELLGRGLLVAMVLAQPQGDVHAIRFDPTPAGEKNNVTIEVHRPL
jgi:hypothetical protein